MLTDEQIRALRDGCEGVTLGPWIGAAAISSVAGLPVVASTGRLICDVNHVRHSAIDPFVEGDKAFNSESLRNTGHIGRCDPQTISELCTRVLEAEAEVRRLNRYDWLKPDAYEKTAYERDGLQARVKTLESEGAQLAANQCHDGYGDEWGNRRCRVQDALQARVKVLEDALRWYASSEAWTFAEVQGPDGDYGTRARKALEEGR